MSDFKRLRRFPLNLQFFIDCDCYISCGTRFGGSEVVVIYLPLPGTLAAPVRSLGILRKKKMLT
jgi:hypothetical protein